jgi:hypothetical protein
MYAVCRKRVSGDGRFTCIVEFLVVMVHYFDRNVQFISRSGTCCLKKTVIKKWWSLKAHAAVEKRCKAGLFMIECSRRNMREELSPNEDIIFAQQNRKVVMGRGSTANKPRQLVSAAGVISWYLLALAALDLWLLRLLGYISLPW